VDQKNVDFSATGEVQLGIVSETEDFLGTVMNI
jgi:hypothetical protein